MATIDLSGYNLSELRGLVHDIEKEIKDRQVQEVKKAREQIQAIAQNLGVSVEDLLAGAGAKAAGKGKGGSGTKVEAQYRNPADSSQTWSGRGRQPQWVKNTIENGGKLEDLRINK
jgi:DNA-binding protein H-NS